MALLVGFRNVRVSDVKDSLKHRSCHKHSLSTCILFVFYSLPAEANNGTGFQGSYARHPHVGAPCIISCRHRQRTFGVVDDLCPPNCPAAATHPFSRRRRRRRRQDNDVDDDTADDDYDDYDDSGGGGGDDDDDRGGGGI